LGGEKEYEFLELDDFYISTISNGTPGQRAMEIDLNRGKGVFTDFIKQFVGEEKIYVHGHTPYWKKRFTCEDMPDNIISCNNPETLGSIAKRRNSKKRKSKRRKSKKSRKKKTRRRSR
jgi:hypothetical protein